MQREDKLAYYAQPGCMTDPKEFGTCLDGLPRDIGALAQLVQGLLMHIFWAERYGLKLSEERQQEVEIRSLAQKLPCLLALDNRPLSEARPIDKRLVGNCRDFSVVLCALLQHQGVPARARCGFGVYFMPNHYEDHWVAEYWNAQQRRWVLVDAQLDALQCRALGIAFDPLDVPRDQFITGGKAWQLCRAGQADPDQFGIMEWHGEYFVQGDLVRDFLALNKVEILPWDRWGLMRGPDQVLSIEDAATLDRLAALTLAGDEAFAEMHALYENDARLRMAPDWKP